MTDIFSPSLPESELSLHDLRRQYKRDALLEEHMAVSPFEQFQQWFDQALQSKLIDPNAMILATTGENMRPDARIVLLKHFDSNGFVFFTNYLSAKGREIEENPNACLLFYWAELERQVRITGLIEKTDSSESEAYFHSRPLESRLSAWASKQSAPIADRQTLEEHIRIYQERYGEAPPRPPYWGGYRLVPTAIEFWQGRPSRLHDRLQYLKQDNGGWCLVRLAP